MERFFFILFFFFNIAAIGQTRNFKGNTQSEMNVNAKIEYEKMDSILSSMYKQILEKNSTDSLFLENFKIAQNNWLTWRRTEIDAFYPNYPDSNVFYGSMQPLCYYSKLMDWTEERIKHFKIYIDGVKQDDLCEPAKN